MMNKKKIQSSFLSNQEVEEEGMSVTDAMLSLISTIIGGGIVGLPYAFFYLGIPFGITLGIVLAFLTHRSCYMYLRAKDLIPGTQESLYEIGYMTVGPKSIYWISSIICVSSFGLMMIYMIVFGDICSSFISDWAYDGIDGYFWTSRPPYIIILSSALFPMIIKKELKELKIVSLILFTGISSFILIFLLQILFEGNTYNQDESYAEYYTISKDLNDIKGFAMILVAFGFQQNFFPMYNSLKEQTNRNALSAVGGALTFTGIVYLIIALLGIFFFGSTIEQNILANVAKEQDHWESYVLRAMFAIVLACHIPFIFFTGKESLLIIIDEFNRKSISKALREKLQDAIMDKGASKKKVNNNIQQSEDTDLTVETNIDNYQDLFD
jgi:amino acid permease